MGSTFNVAYFTLLVALSGTVAKARDIGGGTFKAIFLICKACSLPETHFFVISFIGGLLQIHHHYI